MAEKNYLEESEIEELEEVGIAPDPILATYTVRVATTDFSYIETTLECDNNAAVRLHNLLAKEFPKHKQDRPVGLDSLPKKEETQVNQETQGEPTGDAEKPPLCPKCQSTMYDQRKSKYWGTGVGKTGKPKPIYQCSNKECGHGIWAK